MEAFLRIITNSVSSFILVFRMARSHQRVFRSYGDFAVFDILDTSSAESPCPALLAQRTGQINAQSTIQVCARSQLPDLGSEVCSNVQFECIYGLYHLLAGSYVALVRDSENWVSIKKDNVVNVNIRRAKTIVLYPLFLSKRDLSEEKQRDEEKYLDLLRKGFSMHNMFFSHDFDLTQSQQRIAKMNLNQQQQRGKNTASAAGSHTRADNRFFWNEDVINDLVACNADDWIVPFMSAYVELQPDCDIDGEKFQFLFISRRSRNRQGTRFTRRGIDSTGCTANFVETEQILIFTSGRVTSYVFCSIICSSSLPSLSLLVMVLLSLSLTYLLLPAYILWHHMARV
jgi:hypothetical protein